MKYKLVIFDLDLTLIHDKGLYSDVVDILKLLQMHNVSIALASYNANAGKMLQQYGIENYFQHIFYEDWIFKDVLDWKHQMLSDILSLTGIPSHETVLFDDNKHNLNTAKSLGITAVQVTPQIGVDMKLIIDTLQPENDVCT
ncbi:hypothetical protein EB118_15970 [bacterium]|nr:hypothetical protein [bacterium]NDD83075.1 hypothetical protein [bacterium]NDG31551.1 hypothetical protein [bacterium]